MDTGTIVGIIIVAVVAYFAYTKFVKKDDASTPPSDGIAGGGGKDIGGKQELK